MDFTFSYQAHVPQSTTCTPDTTIRNLYIYHPALFIQTEPLALFKHMMASPHWYNHTKILLFQGTRYRATTALIAQSLYTRKGNFAPPTPLSLVCELSLHDCWTSSWQHYLSWVLLPTAKQVSKTSSIWPTKPVTIPKPLSHRKASFTLS